MKLALSAGGSVNGVAIGDASGNPQALLLSSIGGGSTVGTRVGNACRLRRLQLNIGVNWGLANATDRVRMIIFVDRQPVIGTPASWNDLLTSLAAASANAIQGLRNNANLGRYRIVRDRYIRPENLVSGSAGAQGQHSEIITVRFKGQGRKLHYKSATATDVDGPHYYVVFANDQAGNLPTLRMETALWFQDDD